MNRNLKQIVSAVLAALLCGFTACGQTESAPSPPQTEMTADNLDEEAGDEGPQEEGIGEVYFLPLADGALMGTNLLNVCARKTGLQPGDGVLALCRADGTAVAEIKFDDAQRVELGTLSDADRAFIGWEEEGTKATVILDEPLTQPGQYYVTLTENCLINPETGAGSKALEKGAWTFGVADYGIAGGSLFEKETCAVGETVTISVRLGDGAAKAVLSGFDPEMLEPVTAEVTADGDLALKCVKAGIAQWDVKLLDADGNVIDGTSIAVPVE